MALHTLEPGVRRADQVFDQLHGAITSGDLPAGSRLRIRDVAAELGTSVMPVRDAIGRLEGLGLVESEPYRGAVVMAPSLEEVLSVYDVRRLLEVDACRRGAARLDADELAACERELEAMRSALAEGRGVDYLDHDEAFLGIVYRACGNPVLVDTIRGLWARCRGFKLMGVQRELAAEPVAQDALLAALRQGDAGAAADVTSAAHDASIERIRIRLEEQA